MRITPTRIGRIICFALLGVLFALFDLSVPQGISILALVVVIALLGNKEGRSE